MKTLSCVRTLSIIIFTCFFSSVQPLFAADTIYQEAHLRALDKITARVTNLDVRVGNNVEFGTLLVSVRACHKRKQDGAPEAAAFLEITENQPGEPLAQLFKGWMLSSSPALNALEHPVYDVWLVDCKLPVE